ncbi:uncharacterized protein LOC110991432 isoform X1 [Pieris rapae]|uniref:uncharacterized protein LOC110991432 isoform X1 n=1 Tax=Pieris rapae TaxID=64459 RepID=UPI001E280235|nr:uncharacterized protein LOC110991432 isoform X1 [Pieris rapae]
MDLSVEEYIDVLFSKESTEKPSDTKRPEELEISIPEWYDEKKFNQARRFYWDHCFQFSSSMMVGLVAVFAVPSILKILISTRRSNSVYTSYRRYLSTVLHTVSWFEHEFKPGSISWKSLMAVRTRHVKASLASKIKGVGIISQRDLAITQFGFIGISLLKPDKFGIQQLQPGDWEAYNHFWRTIGYSIGLEDRYNICRATFQETREVCNILKQRVFTPCLTNVPEYFEHLSRCLLDAMWCVNPTINIEGLLYLTKHLMDVPGYVYTETERANLQDKIRNMLGGQSEDIGVDVNRFILEPAVEGCPKPSSRLLYLRHYDSIETIPEYKSLPFAGKYRLALLNLFSAFYTTFLGRLYLNINFRVTVFLLKYFPFLAFPRFGFYASFVNVFEEDPTDDTVVKPNSEYYKPKPKEPWYRAYLPF